MRNGLQIASVLALLLALAACVSVPAPTERLTKYSLAGAAKSSALSSARRRARMRAVHVVLSAQSEEPPAEAPRVVLDPEATGATLNLEPESDEAQRERAAQRMDEQMQRWDRAARRAMGSICRGC